MRRIPPGRTVSYSELAAMAGRPAAARAAAGACARNRVAVVVPCHRVIRGDGGLGGYAFGLEVKQALLDFERRYA
ncbi:methylated-DNA--[protein]-cysteine S-methyltransferase [Arachnia propionica]|uniref:methylated-DNA--[protein]-cysteine S-methyltransferase n=2 Tax=Arachnia propionica TaxID=1750 RepID=A0AB37I717_9ACTN|nr:methylated-DNA--[protein]-cysteine S-methyltransferase [Arachnia propionica]QUC15696.1 methylated-DNA--[protein]-cysteine S-methyltransferase [Arachnia propionica]